MTDRPTSGPLARAGEPLGAGTFVVLDVAGAAAIQVRRIRQRHGYDFYGALPVEITVAGSSGLGSPASDQDARDVFSALDEVAAETPVITGRFGPVLRFPETDIFVLTMENPDPFIDLHQRIGRSGLRFSPSPFPFTPHCTLRGEVVGKLDSQEAEDLLATSADGEFRCDMLSTYTVESFPVLELRHRSHLSSTIEQPVPSP